MTPDQWLEQKFDGEFFSGEFSRFKKIVNDLNLIPKNCKVITVAGTNGKGETSRILNQEIALKEKSVALWTSPHLFKVNERLLFNNEMINDTDLLDSFTHVENVLSPMDYQCSYFEFLFLSFLFLCQQKQPEYIILEVGLGGRLDAANVLDADISLITSISRDHQAILGNRYELILQEKLGVTRKGKQLYTALELQYLQRKAEKYCFKNEIPWTDLFKTSILSSLDNFSMRNQKLAERVLRDIFGQGFSISDCAKNFAKRGEYKVKNTEFDFYSSHNPDGVRKLVHLLTSGKYNEYDTIVLSFSDREYPDLKTMTKVLLGRFSQGKFYFYKFSHPKAIGQDKLKQIKDEFQLEVTNQQQLFKHIDTNKKQKVLCTGSQYFFSDIAIALKTVSK